MNYSVKKLTPIVKFDQKGTECLLIFETKMCRVSFPKTRGINIIYYTKQRIQWIQIYGAKSKRNYPFPVL